MDVIESAVLTELHDKHGLDSLKVQNHIYGCFILMEDIAESVWKKDGATLTGQDGIVYHLDAQFSEIGVRYGFVMDTNLDYTQYSPEYKRAWLECFDQLGHSHDITFVESVEDRVNTVIQTNVKEEDAYFMNSLEHGILPKTWQDKMIKLILGNKTPIPLPIPEKEEELPTSHLSHANVEKPLVVHSKHRSLHKTRRNRSKDISTLPKKSMPKTRRSVRT
jgi:hypothetical protein